MVGRKHEYSVGAQPPKDSAEAKCDRAKGARRSLDGQATGTATGGTAPAAAEAKCHHCLLRHYVLPRCRQRHWQHHHHQLSVHYIE